LQRQETGDAHPELPSFDKCGQCGLALVRIPQPEGHDLVICTGCRSAGSYEEVINQRHGAAAGVLTEKQVKDFLRQIGVGEK
jgi:hypothetical protein